MERWRFSLMVFNNKLKHEYGIKKSLDSVSSIENTIENKDSNSKPNIKGRAQNIRSCGGRDNYSYNNIIYLFGVEYNRNLIPNDTFLFRDNKGDSFYISFNIENHIFEIDINFSCLSELEIERYFYSYHGFDYFNFNNGSAIEDYLYNHYMYDTPSNNHITSCIESYLQSQICVNPSIISDSSDSYIFGCFDKRRTHNESRRSGIRNRAQSSYLTIRESFNNLDSTKKYKHLWVQCENCYGLNYKKFLKSKINLCEQCGYHFKMSSSERIEVLVDPDTWYPMDEDMSSLDPIEFHSEEEPYKDRIYSYQKRTGLTEAVQTGLGQLNGIPIAIGVMDFQFMGGSMGSVVGEKITRLIEYATNKILPLIIVCASGGARMQEGSLSLMQMAKISSALFDYQSNKKLLYVSILTSPTTGGVTASFGMLGDIIIAEPNSYIAFAGKRVIEQTLHKIVPEGSQAAEYLFQKGLFDLIIPRNLLKSVLGELFKLHAFFPLN
uniref:Acetyl-coenzyme A carboxylase carboxyl transferase subunit beta n=1 Tax=Epifagus virginiana TaxID=4177 RepID=ACCD_EPIVI|nr:acetyl-CoA carboxylase beta subunit [Epifagus virginiana]P30064.1 RecName: Full=Acetyl-coenzyme A carboxylase carboxyl transferase subunit beta; Short=ACCase subunit beta; Short=Acetyl-CoA carboxylase carboxyltransferase subunit beta [Epifagus virginiana]AAA65854.1 acetyl-CoA carboxylase [Epifagus virginiana]